MFDRGLLEPDGDTDIPDRHTDTDRPSRRNAQTRDPPARGNVSLVRQFRHDDLGDVTQLFLRVFRKKPQPSRSTELEQCLADILDRPERPSTIPSGFVYAGPSGQTQGFVACLAQPMRLDRASLIGHGGSTLMLDPARRGDAMALIRLLRAFFDVPSDLCFTDTASPVTRAVAERMGSVYLPLHSIDWFLVRSRAAFVMRAGLDRVRIRALDRAVGMGMKAWVGWAKSPSTAVRRRTSVRFVTPTEDDLVAAIVALCDSYVLAPDWRRHPDALRFRLREAAKLTRHGALQASVAFDAAGDPIGCWMAQFSAGGTARVLQVLAGPDHIDSVLANLVEAADSFGCAALRGRVQPELVPALTRLNTFFMPRLSTLVRADDPAVLARCVEGPALLTGLAGETWSRLANDDFN